MLVLQAPVLVTCGTGRPAQLALSVAVFPAHGPRVPSKMKVPGALEKYSWFTFECRYSPPIFSACRPMVQCSESVTWPVTSVRPEGCVGGGQVHAPREGVP